MLQPKKPITDSGFPRSFRLPFDHTSPFNPKYNCIAWAYGCSNKFYWPTPHPLHYWPENIPREEETNSFIKLYESIGYVVCKDGKCEPHFEKVAIFIDIYNTPTHAARQLSSGQWTSKLGRDMDVSHTIWSIEGGVYGVVDVYMKRPWKNSPILIKMLFYLQKIIT